MSAPIMSIDELQEAITQLEARLERLVRCAESSEDWAKICEIEEELVGLTDEYDRECQANDQFGVGA